MIKAHTTSRGAQVALDQIYNDPSTAYVLDLSERFAKKTLDETGFKNFLASLPPEAVRERSKLEQLASNPDASVEADLSTRAGQLVWAAGLGFAFQNSEPGTIRSSAIWKTLTRNPLLSASLGAAARYVDLAITNRSATMDWGVPGSWFFFSPDKNHINIDLFNTLLLGFAEDPAPGMKGLAHALAIMMHEVGHSQYTTRFTDEMIALHERESKFLEENKTRKLTRDEFKQLSRIRAEFHLRADLMNAVEDNCVNRYAANQNREFPHDFSRSLNIGNVLLQGSGRLLKNGEYTSPPEKEGKTPDPEQQKIADAQESFGALSRAAALAFYTTNGLFDASDVETWKRLRVDPVAIKGADGSDFSNLMDQCVGANGVANLQPAARDRWLLGTIFSRSIGVYADQRCQLIDNIWNQYAAAYAEILIDAAEENAEKKLEQKRTGGPNNSGDKSSPQEGGGQSGNGEPQGGGSGSVDVEGVGPMGGDKLPSTPEEARQAKGNKSDQDIKPETAKTVRDLVRDTRQQERKDAANGKSGGRENPEKGGSPGEKTSDGLSMDDKGGSLGQRDVDLAKLSSGDWKQFGKRRNELEPVIAPITDDFIYIRDQQKQLVRDLSREKEELPRGGELRQRLDMRAHMNLAAKRATGQRIERADLQRWKKDEIKTEPTSVELWILGDGSGSTRHPLSDGGRRIDSCLQTMAILYEAGKRADFDVYAGIWENHKVRILAEPGSTDKEIGENFESVRCSGGVGTIYNTPIPGIIERLAAQTTDGQGRQKRFAGMTHFLWVLDGTENDLDVQGTADMLAKLFRYGPAVSVDIAYMGGYTNCETKEIVALVKKMVPGAQIDTLEATRAQDAPIQLVRKIKSRFEQSACGVKAVPDRVKRESFSSAYRAMRTAHL